MTSRVGEVGRYSAHSVKCGIFDITDPKSNASTCVFRGEGNYFFHDSAFWLLLLAPKLELGKKSWDAAYEFFHEKRNSHLPRW